MNTRPSPAEDPIPFNDLRAAYWAHKAAIDAAVQRVLESGWYILGREVESFEAEFAGFCGAAGAVGVNSGTDAIYLALRALDIGPGDEVITTAHTAVATAAAITLSGATPVFADIDPSTYTLDPAALAEAMTPRTRAVIPVHLYGRPADMDPILDVARAAGLAVIEDCAQAHGATYHGRPVGTLGDVGCFSFYPTKNLGALGDGGCVISNHLALLVRLRLLREYGWTPQARYVSQIQGTNSRLDEMQAAILRVRLPRLADDNAARANLAALYAQLLPPQLILPHAAPDRTHVWHLYVVRTQAALRDSLRARLAAQGIGTGIHYPVPIHRQPAYAHGGARFGDLPVTERIAREIISLPLNPTLTPAQVERVGAALHAALA